MRRSRIAVATAALLAAVGSVALATPAQAASSTTIGFNSTTATVVFGSNWAVGLTVAVTGGFAGNALDTQDGTVDVTVDGLPGNFATGVPIYRGGQVFLSQPDSSPLLAAGAHVMHAVFRPSAGSGLVTSQTVKPMTLTVTPLALAAKNELINDATVVGSPILRMSLSGAYVDALGSPPGSWAVTVQNAGTKVLEKTVPQAIGSTTPVEVSIADAAKPGSTLTVSGLFTPDPSVAGGITLTNPPPASFTVPSLTLVEALATPVVLPWWLFILLILIVLGLIATAIVLLVRNRRAAVGEGGPDPDELPVEEPDLEPEPGLWQLSPTVEPGIAALGVAGAAAVPPAAETPADDFPIPGTADLAPLPEPEDPSTLKPPDPEPEKPAPQSWTLSSDDDDV